VGGMTVALNHTIVASRDAEESAAFLSEIMGLPAPERLYHFVMVETANGVSLDFATVADGDDVVTQHYAFLVSEDEFDEIFGRILERGLDHWADPGRSQPGRINRNDGGRGVYFPDPSGHLLEIITRPYGSG
jgi:catechol 2,3-dioxygenase-like lactoylglutathione lyase family enzyme